MARYLIEVRLGNAVVDTSEYEGDDEGAAAFAADCLTDARRSMETVTFELEDDAEQAAREARMAAWIGKRVEVVGDGGLGVTDYTSGGGVDPVGMVGVVAEVEPLDNNGDRLDTLVLVIMCDGGEEIMVYEDYVKVLDSTPAPTPRRSSGWDMGDPMSPLKTWD